MRPEADLMRAELGDIRRTERGALIGATLANRPERSIREAFGDGSALDLAYRWFSNDDVEWTEIRTAHADATWERAEAYPHVLVVHDTTDVSFPRRNKRLRENLSGITNRTQGFYAHVSAVVVPGQDTEVLGVVGLQPYVHVKDVNDDPDAMAFWEEQGGLFDNEAKRWWEAIERAEKSAPAGVEIIHTGDRETDDFSLYALLASNRYRFVLRSYRERSVVSADAAQRATISTALEQTPWIEQTRTVPISARSADRSPKDMKTNPPRGQRWATLSFRACEVQLRRPEHLSKDQQIPATLTLNFVEVLERNPPTETAPVRWVLVTSEPIDSDDDVLAVVDIYCARWTIEEFFKCLKSGCLLESAQLDSASALLRLLAVLLPVATYLMHIRYMQRAHPDEPATAVFGEEEIEVLKQQHPECFSSPTPTVSEAVSAVAHLGGHLSRNGRPGWLTLARGTNALHFLMQGWRLAMGRRSRNGSYP